MSDQVFVIVGASLTGASAAEQLRSEGFDGAIVLIGEESSRPYERPPLSKDYLRGETPRDRFEALEPGYYAQHGIDLRTSTRAEAIDPEAREVALDDGSKLRYDRLLLATGSAPRHLRIPGHDLRGVHYLRTIDDADALREAASQASDAVVVGAGWIGAEVAASLRQLDLSVSMISPDPMPLVRVLGPEVGRVYLDLHRENGVQAMMGQGVVAFHGDGAVDAVETDAGQRVKADLVVVGIGATPRTQLAVGAGLDVSNGIDVDETLATSAPDVYAAGDVAAAWHPRLEARLRVEHWDNARRQGRHAATNMLGAGESYTRLPYFFSDQYDLGMEYRGHATDWDAVVFRGSPEGREFLAFWLKDGRVLAAMNANVWKVGKPITALIESHRRVDRDRLADASVPLDDLAALAPPSGT
jgi:3-phenylpropionate/trans-cinnamate dioxygenase ferredoxin reductase subunit